MSKKNLIKAIIFDIDGTLSADASWFKLTEGLGASVEKHSEIFEKYTKREISYKKAKRDLVKLWQSTGNANKDYMSQMFNSWKLKGDAHEIISYLRNRYKIVLISGSLNLYVKSVADKLQVDDWYANTNIDWDSKNNLVNLHYFRNQALKKLNQFRHFKKKYSLKNKECAAVGDGDTDLLLFQRVKTAILVKKEKVHPELEPFVFKKIDNLEDLKKIF